MLQLVNKQKNIESRLVEIPGNEKILSLTGLRFLAALFVALAHLMPKVMPFTDPPIWYQFISSLAAVGMTLFFVLSGFVIHYNYSYSLATNGITGLYNFFVARFARIYPLYFAILAYELLFGYSYSQLPPETLSSLPFYAFMLQSWVFYPLGQNGLIYLFGALLPLTWSISTEWFFYLGYPFIRVGLDRIRSVSANLCIGALTTIAVLSGIFLAVTHMDSLNHFGATIWGTKCNSSVQTQYSFFRWLIYFSPYSRIWEFFLGCVCASIFLKLRNKPVTRRENRLGLLLLLGAISGAFAIHYYLFGDVTNVQGLRPLLINFHMCYGYAPFVAIIIFCVARYKNFVAKCLSSQTLVICGEASYSLYLWHMMVVMAFRWEAAPVTSFTVGIGDFLRLTVALSAAIGLSLVSWHIIEKPARRLIRKLLLKRIEAV